MVSGRGWVVGAEWCRSVSVSALFQAPEVVQTLLQNYEFNIAWTDGRREDDWLRVSSLCCDVVTSF